MPLGAQRYKIMQILERRDPLSFSLAFPDEYCIFWYRNEYVETKNAKRETTGNQQLQDGGTNEEYICIST